MTALRDTARALLDAGVPAMDVQVLAHRGSVPRESGTHMLVTRDAVLGTIGGGHLELTAIAQARQWLDAGDTASHDIPYALGPSLGQCCGGSLTLRTQRLGDAVLAAWPAREPRFFLQLYGAGHVGRAIVALLSGIDCRVQWVDERESEFPAQALPAHIERVCVEPVEAEVAQAPAGAHYLVLTHSHDLDLRITEAILRRGDFAFLGLIGSRTKRARFVHRLEERGVPPEALARLTCPIGVPGIAGKEPQVIAVAVVAQLLQR
ncbi:xanthine dehydrogenase accessory protein XdhC [Rhizobacter sp. SG703]|uniref:xanthine dehydrogenase accessory protein XdhC n=1 Tax=Rhizobacter sp. SG703 TaxID=2587140 RepID=UPI001447ECCB|nr:xanthine dehydrogenase accessory protein XdhC [Rhizobacter sp. SG703]NKI94909.1 xanthine dehydrogenase accessory factor [Rhizobacter sp. SG703]